MPQYQALQPLQHAPEISKNTLNIGDGTSLPLRSWQPKNAPKAVILALHGFNDYSNAFDMPAAYFASKGILTYAYDQRGFGASPHTGIWAGAENIERDLAQAVKAVSSKHPQLPLYILGESMGGAVTVAAMTESYFPADKVAGVMLSAPALWGENTLNPLHRFILWAAVHQLPSMHLTGNGLKILASDNIPMLVALGKDPFIIKKTRIDTVYGLVQIMDKAHARIAQLNKPTLLMYGHHDQVIPPIALGSVMYQLQQNPDAPIRKSLKIGYYDTGWHMLMRDTKRHRVWDDMASWMLDHTAALPSQAEASPENFWRKTIEYRAQLSQEKPNQAKIVAKQ